MTRLLTAAFVLLVCVLTAIGETGMAAQPPTRKAGDLEVTVGFRPDPPKPGKSEVTLLVTGKDKKPVTGAKVRLFFGMPSMGMEKMGMATARETKPGSYQASTTFSMAGEWEMKVMVTPKGGRKQTVSFTFKV